MGREGSLLGFRSAVSFCNLERRAKGEACASYRCSQQAFLGRDPVPGPEPVLTSESQWKGQSRKWSAAEAVRAHESNDGGKVSHQGSQMQAL